jgi:hypothetical protein
MAFALLLTTALAAIGFLATSIQGFLLASAREAASSAVQTLVRQHVGWAIPAVLFSLFSQSMVIFYFIGTGKLVKEEVAGYPEKEKAAILAALRRFKAKTSPVATFSLLSAIAVFVLGGAVHTRALPSWTHLAASVAAVLLHGWAFAAEWRVFGENHSLMDDPRGYARALAQEKVGANESRSGRGGEGVRG